MPKETRGRGQNIFARRTKSSAELDFSKYRVQGPPVGSHAGDELNPRKVRGLSIALGKKLSLMDFLKKIGKCKLTNRN